MKDSVASKDMKSTSESPDDRKSAISHSKTSINLTNKKKDLLKRSQTHDSKEGDDEAKMTSINLIEWTYEYFMNRSGLKNVADKKYK